MKPRSKPPSTSCTGISDPAIERVVAKQLCERDHLFFTRYFFRHRQGNKFRVNWHHQFIADIVESVIDGRRKNVVINVAPGSSKTELVTINLIARGLALNPWSRFLHISYSDDLALLNSQTAREIVQSDEFQALWPLAIADDARAKKRWNVVVDGKKAGGVYAVSLGGQITGFRAGHMAEGWQGAILIDDPLKPEDAYSKTKRDAANRRLLSTVKSRKACPDTPIIMIMQRLAEQDPTGFIKAGNVPGDWEFFSIPALMADEDAAALPGVDHAVAGDAERDEKGRFSYWPYKEPLGDLLTMERGGVEREGQVMSRYVFAGQYQQRPAPLGGDLIKGEWFRRYRELPQLEFRKIFADTAQKTAERNDYTVFECWGRGTDSNAYLLDVLRGKWPAPELKRRALDFWRKHEAAFGDDPFQPVLREFAIEDKSSGTGLIQEIEAEGGIPVRGIQRGDKDKLVRVQDVTPRIEAGRVFLPESAPWVSEFITECEAFTADDTHAHDDQIDPMCDAITDLLPTRRSLYDSL